MYVPCQPQDNDQKGNTVIRQVCDMWMSVFGACLWPDREEFGVVS